MRGCEGGFSPSVLPKCSKENEVLIEKFLWITVDNSLYRRVELFDISYMHIFSFLIAALIMFYEYLLQSHIEKIIFINQTLGF